MNFYVIGRGGRDWDSASSGSPDPFPAHRDEALEAFRRVTGAGDVLVLIITEQISAMIAAEVMDWQFNGSYPLIVEIPGIEGHLENRKSLIDSIREAVGVHV